MRFYIDERVGCIAVREHVDNNEPESQGLHEDYPDVMAYWMGEKEEGASRWRILDWQIEKATRLCDELNKG